MTRPTTNLTRRPAARPGLELLEDRTVPSWLAQVGGPGEEYSPSDQGMDSAGNLYLAGEFEQTVDFDPGPQAVALTSAGGADGFVGKYDPAGALTWARRFGGSGKERVTSVAADPTGQFVYLTGAFEGSADFTGDGKADATSRGYRDIFLVKLDAATGQTVWTRTLGSAYQDVANDVATDGAFVYVTGSFAGAADFDPGPGTRTLTPAGNGKQRPADAFVWKLDVAGNFSAAWQVGGAAAAIGVADEGKSIVLDGDAFYLQGCFTGTADFDPGSGVQSRTSVGQQDQFIARYTTAGALTWVRAVGGAEADTDFYLGADAGSVYLAGAFWGSVDFDPGSGAMTFNAGVGSDVAVVKYGKADGSLSWARQYGGGGSNEYAGRCLVDPATGAVYFGMNFASPAIDLDPANPGGEFTNAGSFDGLLVKLGAAGNYLSAWQAAGAGYEGGVHPLGVAGGTVFAAGRFQQTAAFPTGGSLTSNGGSDLYLMALDTAPPPSASVAGGSVLEGTDGRVALTFTATPSGAYAAPVVLTYRTADGTATTETALRVPAGSQAPPPAGGRPVIVTAAGGRHTGRAALADPTRMWWGVELDPAAA